MILDGFSNFLYQFLYLFGILILVCAIVGLCERLFYKQLGAKARTACIMFGVIGVPVHESGHALMCLLFGHKIHKIVFFQPAEADKSGVLGFVEHSYNPKNFYQVIGRFFISLGPIILGTAVLVLLMFLLERNLFYELTTVIERSSGISGDLLLKSTYLHYWDIFKNVLVLLFAPENLTSVTWWVFILISLSVSLHMGLSTVDMKNGVVGLLAVTALLLAVNLVLSLISYSLLDGMNYYVLLISGWMFSFLSVSVVMSAALVVFTYLVRHLGNLIVRHRWAA